MTAPASSSGQDPQPATTPRSGVSTLESTVRCQFCGRVLDTFFVNPAGELIGCESCADLRGLAGELLTLEEWNAPAALPQVLRQFGIGDAEVRKPSPIPTQQPRTHYWEVLAPGGRYFLRRFYSWYPASAIRYMHSVTARLALYNIPAPQYIPTSAGLSYACSGWRWRDTNYRSGAGSS